MFYILSTFISSQIYESFKFDSSYEKYLELSIIFSGFLNDQNLAVFSCIFDGFWLQQFCFWFNRKISIRNHQPFNIFHRTDG